MEELNFTTEKPWIYESLSQSNGAWETVYLKNYQQRQVLFIVQVLSWIKCLIPFVFLDIRYQMHICHISLKQPVQALLVLQGIPAKLRSVKVNMALGKLYVMNGLERPAISAFKEVLRECPLALEAIQSLIKLGIRYTELLRLIFNGTPPNQLEW